MTFVALKLDSNACIIERSYLVVHENLVQVSDQIVRMTSVINPLDGYQDIEMNTWI